MTELSLKVFCSYSHKDEHLREELDKHLSPFIHSGLISTWSDRKILPGEVWDEEIKNNLKTADIILLLISADFLASKYCWEVEVNTAIERHKAKEACVIPVILRSVYWKYPPLTLAQIQALPKNAKAVTTWADRDEAFTNVVDGIWVAVENFKQEREEHQQELQRQRQQKEAERLQRKKEAEILRRQESTRFTGNRESSELLLSSDKGVDYTRLRDLLKAGNWKEADRETLKVMLQAAGKEKERWLNIESIKKFPCTDLRTIDQLWVRYSDGKYGLSVQTKIWLEVGGKWNAFYTRVGWQISQKWFLGGWVKGDLKYYGTIPIGHLPGYWIVTERVRQGMTGDKYDARFPSDVISELSSLASRLVNCNI